MAFLLEESTLDAEQKGYLDAITQSGEMLLRVLSDILDISKVEGGDFSISADPFVAQDLVGSVTHLFEGKVRQGGNTLIGTVEPPEPIVLSGDAGRIDRRSLGCQWRSPRRRAAHMSRRRYNVGATNDSQGGRICDRKG